MSGCVEYIAGYPVVGITFYKCNGYAWTSSALGQCELPIISPMVLFQFNLDFLRLFEVSYLKSTV